MSRTRYRNNMPPGLGVQITVAVIITLGAILVLPNALSASQSPVPRPAKPVLTTQPSAGTIATTVRRFSSSDFAAAAFSDWD